MTLIFALILAVALISLSISDWVSFRLPNALTLPLIAIGLIQAALITGIVTDSLIGAALGYAIFVLIEISFKALRGKAGLGRGDAKLLAAGGAWTGWMGLPYIILIASGLGLIGALFPSLRRLSTAQHIPFGPFLALAIAIVWIVTVAAPLR